MITTARLRLRPWTDADEAFATDFWGDSDVTRFIDARPRLDPAAAIERVRREQGFQERHGLSYWLMETHDGEPVGVCGLHPRGEELELGFAVAPTHWRRGYAREAARAAIVWAFGERPVESLYAGHHPDNEASAALLESLGFVRDGEELFEPTGRMHPAYRLARPEAAGVEAVYDLVAEQYVEQLSDELDGKPFDRDWLRAFAERNGDRRVADVGCGPGHVARFLAEAGAKDVTGLDLSARMVDLATERHPELSFAVCDMDELRGEWGAILSMYSIVNRPTATLEELFRRWRGAVEDGAEVALAFHCGGEVLPLTDWWDHDVLIDFVFHETAAVVAALEVAGWAVVDVQERESYGLPIEYPSRRAYVRGMAR